MRRAPTIALSLAFALSSASARATTVLDLSLAQLSARASIVCVGKVIDAKASWYGDHAAIVTRVRLRVTEVLKGNSFASAGHELAVMETGGEIGGVGQFLPGAAHFDIGEDVVVFLEPAKHDPGVWVLPTMSASKFRAIEMADGRTMLAREFGDLTFVRPTTSGRLEAHPASQEATISLDELRGIVGAAK
jgi:hypothetical protein